MMKQRFGQGILLNLLSLAGFVFIILGCLYLYLDSQVPSVESLKKIQLQTPLRVYSIEGKLIGEYGEKRRIPVNYDQIPPLLIEAVLATEDRRYFQHGGVDIVGLARAGVELIKTGQKSQGGSTITMQVARNFFLTRKKSFLRKINEIMLAMRIDRELSKEKILELYLNKIYFGQRAYGVAAAAEVYYGKTLSELTLPEMAMIAGLPQAPSANNPISNPTAAKERRNHVLFRMLEEHIIDDAAYQKAINTPLTEKYHGRKIEVEAPYVAEMVRQALLPQLGKDIYTNGYKVYTTIQAPLQAKANAALQKGLLDYDKRHRYRGAVGHITQVNELKKFLTLYALKPVMITQTNNRTGISAITASGQPLTIPIANIGWGIRPAAYFKKGDVIYAEERTPKQWFLVQIPQVQGALVVMNPTDGAVLALDGGFDFYSDNFNHAAQAMRQAGSSFKPFLYSAALDKGFTLASVFNDSPVVISEPGQPVWRPQNDDKKFHGSIRLRVALTKSINLISIRLLEAIGMPYALQYVERFGFLPSQLPQTLSLALGTADATPLQMTTGFATFANSGFRVDPYLIDHVMNERDQVILKTDAPEKAYSRPIITPQNAYLMTSALQGVVLSGTGSKASTVLRRTDLAGKTGTSNDQRDAWFVGYTPQYVATAWVGYSKFQKSIYEHGAQAALPIWIDFMQFALQGKPDMPFNMPDGIVSLRINPVTGLLARADDKNAIFEVFQEGHLPADSSSAGYLANPYGPANESADPIF